MEVFIDLCSRQSTLGDDERRKKVLSLLESGQLHPATKGHGGWYPLHYAAKFGRGNIVDLLLSRSSCEPHLQTKDKRYTALHIASQHCQLDVVEVLLKYMPNGDPPKQDREGNTPLHTACKSGSLDIVNRLTRKYSSNSLQQLNQDGATPLGIAVLAKQASIARFLLSHEQVVGNPTSTFQDFRSIFPQFKYRQSLDHPVNIFVMGNRHTGKSTLIKSIQTQGAIKLAIGAFMPTSGVEYHSGGVVLSDVSSNNYGRVKFCELASCQQSTQEHIFSAMKEPGNAIFIITLSSKDEMKEMEATLLYWLCFIHHQLRSMGINVMPYIAVVGSFLFYYKFSAVRLDNRHRLHLVYHRVLAAHSELCGNFHFIGKFSMDCRRSESPGMRLLKRVLRRKSRELRPGSGENSLPSLCYVLLSALHLMRQGQANLPIVRLSEIEQKIAERSLNAPLTLFNLLPREIENIRPLLNKLEECKAVVIFHHLDRRDPWVLFDEFKLMSKIDDTLIQKGLRLSTSSFNPAIMSEEELCQRLSSLCVSLDKDVLLNILHHFKITEVMARGNDTKYFLPSVLIQISPTTDITPPISWNALDTKYTLGFAQCIVPNSKQMIPFFMPRFLYFLLYELFTMTESGDFDHVIMSHSALHLSLDPQLEIYITIDSSSIILYMRCSESGVFSCLQYRNQFETIIHQQRELLQPNVNVLEYLVPLENLSFPVMKIRQIETNGMPMKVLKRFLTTGDISSTTIAVDSMTRLRSFEPYGWLSCLQKTHLDNLLDHRFTNVVVSKAFCEDLRNCVGVNWEKLLEYSDILQEFNPDISGEELEIEETGNENTKPSQQQPTCTYGGLLAFFCTMSIFKTTSEMVAIFKAPINPPSESDVSQPSDLSQPGTTNQSATNVSNNESITDFPPSSSTSSSVSALEKLPASHRDPSPLRPDATCSTSSDASSIASIGMQYNLPTLKVIDTVVSKNHVPQDIQFITDIMVIKCDKKGGRYYNESHNFSLTVLPQAIPDDIDIFIEFALALVGPYRFPETLTPVSPILWVRMKKESGTEKLRKPLEIGLPHAVNCSQQTNLLRILCSQSQGVSYNFEKAHKMSKIQPGSGILQTKLSKHQYHFCIAAKLSPEVVSRTQYFLVKVAPKPEFITDNSWKLYFFVTYSLPTYIEMVKQQFGEKYTVDERAFLFDTSNNSEPCIRIKYMRETPEQWTITKEGLSQIEPSKVDMQNGSNYEMSTMTRLHKYPPSFTIAINGHRATANSCVEFDFEGVAHEHLKYEIFLHVLRSPNKKNEPFHQFRNTFDEQDKEVFDDNNSYNSQRIEDNSLTYHNLQRTVSVLSIRSAPGDVRQIYFHGYSNSSPPKKDMEKKDAMAILSKQYSNICTHLNNGAIRAKLVEYNALTFDQVRVLLDSGSPSEANERLISYIVKGGVSGFKQFIKALKKTSDEYQGHHELLNDLTLDLVPFSFSDAYSRPPRQSTLSDSAVLD